MACVTSNAKSLFDVVAVLYQAARKSASSHSTDFFAVVNLQIQIDNSEKFKENIVLLFNKQSIMTVNY